MHSKMFGNKILTYLSIYLLRCTIVHGFPFPEECGIQYIQPDHIGNASRWW